MTEYAHPLLNLRERTHGEFPSVAASAQAIKTILFGARPWREAGRDLGLDDPEVVVEALDLIATKLARITCGDPLFLDHWRDISGYADLVVAHLRRHDDREHDDREPDIS
jgi:hypothetical protein